MADQDKEQHHHGHHHDPHKGDERYVHGVPTFYLPSTETEFDEFVTFADSSDSGWRSAYASSDGKVKVWDRKSDVSSINIVRLVAKLSVDALVLYDTLHDPDYRKEWDDNMIEGFLIEQIDDNNDVGYYSAKSPAVMVSARDFCNERSWQVKGDRQYVIMNHSVIHPKCPEKKGIRKGKLNSDRLSRADKRRPRVCFDIHHPDRPSWLDSNLPDECGDCQVCAEAD